MRIAVCTGQSEKQLLWAAEIPTWQWLWSVSPAITWDAYGSLAARLELRHRFPPRHPSPGERGDPDLPRERPTPALEAPGKDRKDGWVVRGSAAAASAAAASASRAHSRSGEG